jgi:hypothetical protein
MLLSHSKPLKELMQAVASDPLPFSSIITTNVDDAMFSINLASFLHNESCDPKIDTLTIFYFIRKGATLHTYSPRLSDRVRKRCYITCLKSTYAKLVCNIEHIGKQFMRGPYPHQKLSIFMRFATKRMVSINRVRPPTRAISARKHRGVMA